jgi:HMG (high mobility group) box
MVVRHVGCDRQYALEEDKVDIADMSRIIAETWRSMLPAEKAPYEAAAAAELAAHQQEKRHHEALQRQWNQLYTKCRQAGVWRRGQYCSQFLWHCRNMGKIARAGQARNACSENSYGFGLCREACITFGSETIGVSYPPGLLDGQKQPPAAVAPPSKPKKRSADSTAEGGEGRKRPVVAPPRSTSSDGMQKVRAVLLRQS